jgi:thioredoxin-dependent peroxiredoxin
MIKVGERAPEFEAPASDGRTLRLSELTGAGKAVVLYFFPKAFTSG